MSAEGTDPQQQQQASPPKPTIIAPSSPPPTAQQTSGGGAGGLAKPRKHRMSVRNASTSAPTGARYNISVDGDDGGIEMRAAADKLQTALECRPKYKHIDKGQCEPLEKLPHPLTVQNEDGVFKFGGMATRVVPWEEYYDDVNTVYAVVNSAACQKTCRYRMEVLEEKYKLYKVLNSDGETSFDRYRRGGGVHGNTMRVDNTIQLQSCVDPAHMLDFIQHAYETRSDEIVTVSGEREQSLKQLFTVLDMDNVDALTVEGLGLQPSVEKQFTRFDVFDPEINRAGRAGSDILKVFLTNEGPNEGRLFADAVRTKFDQIEASGKKGSVQALECYLPLYGKNEEEWDELARWLESSLPGPYSKTMWIIEIPRIASIRSTYSCEFQQQHIDNLFKPLFIATMSPQDAKNAQLSNLLQHVGGFSIRSDEEAREHGFTRDEKVPSELSWDTNPSDLYFAYYVWANICALNAFRRRRGMNTFQFRFSAGERATQLDELVCSYLLCDGIDGGAHLEGQPALQFLYGAKSIPIFMSPLRSNNLQLSYLENPFPSFFRRGLTVCLSTCEPLHFHHSTDPLQEEYSAASRMFKLSPVDLSEIARNSVIASSFPDALKQLWIGDKYAAGSVANDHTKTAIPSSRLALREDAWNSEMQIIEETILAVRRRHSLSSNDFKSLLARRSSSVSAADLSSTKRRAKDLPVEVTQDGSVNFTRVQFLGKLERDTQSTMCSQFLHRALSLRKVYVWTKKDVWAGKQHRLIENAFKKSETFNEDDWMYKTVFGIVVAHEVHQVPRLPEEPFPKFAQYKNDLADLKSIVENTHVQALCSQRLSVLEHKFALHLAVNHSAEAASTEERLSQNRDFYQATKVDTNVQMESGMTARTLLDFIITKAQNHSDDIVSQKEGEAPVTLRQLLERLNIDPVHLTVDDLGVQVDATNYGKGGDTYTPEGRTELLNLLLKTDNTMRGRYFAELTKLTFEEFKRDRFTFAENRLCIYGQSKGEWDKLSSWFDTHGMASHNNMWMIQIPRIYSYLRKNGSVQSFADYINNIFHPLWEVSLHPSKNPRLFHFLNHVSGFDCVEDETKADLPINTITTIPTDWTTEENPPYQYYMYYIWANIWTINEFRSQRKFSTFAFRPSSGESGSPDHLLSGFLLSNSVNYGINLTASPTLQYLFYLAQIGLAASPLSNNSKVLDYLSNPFPAFFRRGLNLSLGTDAPLQFHHTQEPLIEEYSIASKVWKLSPNDMCEIARNSVLHSGFNHDFKVRTIGKHYFLSSSASNDASKTHLSDVRVAYRWETYHNEMQVLEYFSGLKFPRAMLTLEEEQDIIGKVEKEEVVGQREGIIAQHHDTVDLQKLYEQRAQMLKDMEDSKKMLEDLKKQNKKLYENLKQATVKEAASANLRANLKTAAEASPVNAGYGTAGQLASPLGLAARGDDNSPTEDADDLRAGHPTTRARAPTSSPQSKPPVTSAQQDQLGQQRSLVSRLDESSLQQPGPRSSGSGSVATPGSEVDSQPHKQHKLQGGIESYAFPTSPQGVFRQSAHAGSTGTRGSVMSVDENLWSRSSAPEQRQSIHDITSYVKSKASPKEANGGGGGGK